MVIKLSKRRFCPVILVIERKLWMVYFMFTVSLIAVLVMSKGFHPVAGKLNIKLKTCSLRTLEIYPQKTFQLNFQLSWDFRKVKLPVLVVSLTKNLNAENSSQTMYEIKFEYYLWRKCFYCSLIFKKIPVNYAPAF
jgi:hypothetical protein